MRTWLVQALPWLLMVLLIGCVIEAIVMYHFVEKFW